MKKRLFVDKKKIKILQRKADRLHRQLFLHINKDIFVNDTNKLFNELSILNEQISLLSRSVTDRMMYL